MKKLISVLAAFILVLCMGTTAFAADPVTDATLKVKTRTDVTQFTAYKVMAATVSGIDQEGNSVYTYAIDPAFSAFFTNGVNGYTLGSHNEILDSESNVVVNDGTANTNTTEASKLAAALAKYARTNSVTGTVVSGETGETLPIGYYLVVETVSNTNNNKYVASKPILVDLRSDTEINPKDAIIDLEKKIVENGNEVDANDVSVGDTVNYKVKTAVPTYEANVDKTKLSFVITDTFSKGLTYQENLVITAGDAENSTTLKLNDDYNVTFEQQKRELTITLTQDAIIDNQGKDLVLTYGAVLNPDAEISNIAGNPNNVKLEYTNNPNIENSKNTITDETVTYTYGFRVHKVDKNNSSANMAGATFTIENEGGEIVGNFSYDKDGAIKAGENVVIVDNYAEITGLDEGVYTVKETVAPEGYSKLVDPVTVTITAVKDENGLPTGKAQLTAAGAGNAMAEVGTSKGDGTIDLVVKIENVKGISLPGTGGMGTKMFLLIGAGMILLARGIVVVMKISKRKKSSRV